MNTLTSFINQNFALLTHTDSSSETMVNDFANSALYEIIENETLNECKISDLTISGSLFSLTTFTLVTLESCVFYATRWENCTFKDCNFKDCTFEFSNLSHCKFTNCTFENCSWELSPLNRCELSFCKLDSKTQFYLSKEENFLWGCLPTGPQNWAQALNQEGSMDELPPLPSVASEEVIRPLGVLVNHFKKRAA
jgi:hypothetical protein